ncbi:hypothetical protein ACHAWF_006907 [Thalassiosira exigua]
MKDYTTHQKVSIILMKVGGLLSMTADHFIMRDFLIRYHKGERVKLTKRIVCELSFAQFWASFFSAFLGTWMVPKESGDFLAAGNTASCTAQGFLQAFFYGLCVIMDATLALTYCILVKHRRRDEARSKRSLWLILGLPPIVCFMLAVKPLFDQAYNYTDFHSCGIAEHPLGCLNDNYDFGCSRGKNARELKIARFSITCLAFTIIVVSVCVLITHAISTERRATNIAVNYNSLKVTWQGIFYVAAFIFSWGPWYLWQWIRITSGMETMAREGSPTLLYLISITLPLQGVMNALVFFRPKYLKYRKRHIEELRLKSILRTLDLAVPKILSAEWWRSLKSNQIDEDEDGAYVA